MLHFKEGTSIGLSRIRWLNTDEAICIYTPESLNGFKVYLILTILKIDPLKQQEKGNPQTVSPRVAESIKRYTMT